MPLHINILLLCDAINDDSNGGPNHTSSMSNPQQAISMATNILFLKNAPANVGQRLFTSPNYKRIK